MSLSIELQTQTGQHILLTPFQDVGLPMHEHEYTDLRYSTAYPGGFDQCSFSLARSSKYSYQDIGYFGRVTVYWGAEKVVWDGEIRQIRHRMNKGIETMNIGCLGHSAVLSDGPYNRIFRDTRYNVWYTPNSLAGPANAVPQAFIADNQDRLFLGAREGVTYANNATIGYWAYDEPFNVDLIKELTFTYKKNFAASWEVRLVSADNKSFTTNVNVEWTITAASADDATVTVTLGTVRRHLVLQLIYNASAAAYTDDDAETYIQISGLTVKSDANALTAKLVAEDIVEKYSNARYGLDSSTAEIESITLDLVAGWYTADMTGDAVLNLISEYGNASGQLVGWAIWEDKKLVLETMPLDEIAYSVDVADVQSISVDGDVQRNYQRAYAVARDADGTDIIGATRDVFDDLGYGEVFGDRRRERAIDVPITSDATTAQLLADLYLKRNALPAGRGTITLHGGGLKNFWGNEIPLAMARADGVIQVKNYRAFEAELLATATDQRDREFTDMVVKTSYDADRDQLTISPGEVEPSLQEELNAVKKSLGSTLDLWGNKIPRTDTGV